MMALQKKSPGQRPGHSFLQKEVYQPHHPLVKTKINSKSVWTRAGRGHRLTKFPAEFQPCSFRQDLQLHCASTSYIRKMSIKNSSCFSVYSDLPELPAHHGPDLRLLLRTFDRS